MSYTCSLNFRFLNGLLIAISLTLFLGLNHSPIKPVVKQHDGSVYIHAYDYDKGKLIHTLADVCHKTMILKNGIIGKVSVHAEYRSCDHLWQEIASLGYSAFNKNQTWVVEDGSKSSQPYIFHPKHQPVDQLVKWVNEQLSKNNQCVALSHSSAIVCPESPNIEKWLTVYDQPISQVEVQAWIWLADKHEMRRFNIWNQSCPKDGCSIDLPVEKWFRLIKNIQIWSQQGSIKLLASPQMIIMNQDKATIAAGDEIPFWQEKNAQTIVDFKKALLSLSVKPLHIHHSKGLYEIELHYDKPASSPQNQRHIIRHHLKTKLSLPHHHAVLIGGIEQTYQDKDSHCPYGLQYLPIVGPQMCGDYRKNHKKSLYMLISTRKIISDQSPE